MRMPKVLPSVVDVAVTDGEQGGSGPPDSGEGISEHLRLGVMLHAVEAQAGGHHQHQYDKKRRKELLALPNEHLRNDIERVVVPVDTEEAQNPCHPKHPEGGGASREHHRQVGREEGQQINQAGTGYHVLAHGTALSYIWVQALRREQPKNVIHAKEGRGHFQHQHQSGAIGLRQMVIGHHKSGGQIDNQRQRAEDVVTQTQGIRHRADGYHSKEPVLQAAPRGFFRSSFCFHTLNPHSKNP